MYKEYRKSKRVIPNVNIEIVDILTSKKIGGVMNISSEGLLVSCTHKVDSGLLFQTQWNFDARGYKSISVGIECLWSTSQISNVFLMGFHIIDISQDDQDILDRIIAQSKEVKD